MADVDFGSGGVKRLALRYAPRLFSLGTSRRRPPLEVVEHRAGTSRHATGWGARSGLRACHRQPGLSPAVSQRPW